MLGTTILDDHAAGQEMLSVAGNAAEPASEERTDELAGLAARWNQHGAMLHGVVLPRLAAAGRQDQADALGRLQRAVAEGATALARPHDGPHDGPNDGPDDWLSAFERLKAAFDAQCRSEQNDLLPWLRDGIPPAELARMTVEARDLDRPGHR